MANREFIKRAKKYLEEIYKPYNNKIYVPMPETRNLFLPVTIGCSYNKCLYCGLNKNIRFEKISLEEIEENLKKLQFITQYNRRKVEKFNLLGGNPLVLETEYLVEISRLIRKYFPKVKYISSFSRVDDILRKSHEELVLLKESKFNRLSLGIESGSDKILEFQRKGVTSKDNLAAMRKLEKVKLDYSAYIILGFGGVEYSRENAIETARLLNKVHPFELVVVNLVYFPNAPLLEKVRTGEFKRLSPLQSLEEEYLLLYKLEMENVVFNATHKNNTIAIKGKLPEHKNIMLKEIEKNIKKYSLKL
ncbi:MAG: radical SAM protein [Miniphocaeibacter sp.]|uniref:radical SAM protein n=1 Tax=Miniphocaeibacter sp. TaxID=3100973 RepID=UPI00179D2D0C|nr:radical SAM protein [Gallicola sp.]